MIHYALRCDAGHEFDGWFPGSAAFDTQSESGLVECPGCGSVRVSRALMAPAVSARMPEPAPPPSPAAHGERKMPAEVMAAMQKLRQAVEQNCDYVGPNFADQARQMHRGEIETKGIYGETTPAQAEALHDEGIVISAVPWVERADS